MKYPTEQKWQIFIKAFGIFNFDSWFFPFGKICSNIDEKHKTIPNIFVQISAQIYGKLIREKSTAADRAIVSAHEVW